MCGAPDAAQPAPTRAGGASSQAKILFVPHFHPLVEQWFKSRFEAPSAPQSEGWEHIATGRDTLIAAPTGSGKTLAAFLWSIDQLVRQAAAGTLDDTTHVVYVSPLKALSNDINKNLREPLEQIQMIAREQNIPLQPIRTCVRTGDTPAAERAAMAKRPPHILITTPESLYILLTAARSRDILAHARTMIVDEIHAVARDKRGAHLAVTLERLDLLAGRQLQRIGLSATQKPIEEIARLLIGAGRDDCAIVDAGHQRRMQLELEIADQELGPIATHELWAEIYDRICKRVDEHRTTLVFVNTRRLVERVAHQLSTRLGDDRVAAHHGSMSRQARLDAETKLKSGEVSVVVATASLELGIDIGHVDLVVQIGAPRSIATLLQRVGRSGHWLGAIPRGLLFPLTRDDLLGGAACVRAVRAGELDGAVIAREPIDVLAQQMVATAASMTPRYKKGEEFDYSAGGIDDDELFAMMRRAWPYRDLERAKFDELLDMLSEGVASRKGRRSAHLHRDRINGRMWGRRGARMIAITNGGTIPETADYDVVEATSETFVGRINEDFAIESMAGDIFLLGNRSWRIQRVAAGKVWVQDAQGAPPSIPFWLGEAPARTEQLSTAVSRLREEISTRLAANEPDTAIETWLDEQTACGLAGAQQLIAYVRETAAALGCVPTTECVIAERFFDEAGGMQLVIHAPFGGRINRAWGLALRKRFCVNFDFELQAAATDDGIVLSLGEQHSFPLESVFSYVATPALEKDLVTASLQSPMFTNRWRWNATRALAMQRFRHGKKIPMAIQRMHAEDLLTAVFPECLACQDNRVGPPEPPDHPLVRETIDNCLREAMDIDGLRAIIERIEDGTLRCVAVETPAPSPMSHEILNANPYAFLDDAPLEERRARAVSLRRTDAALATSMGAPNPEAIAEVRAQAWPELRSPHELADFLLSVGWLPAAECDAWPEFAAWLVEHGRAVWVTTPALSSTPALSPPPAFTATHGVTAFLQQLSESCNEKAVTPASHPGRALVAIERLSWLNAILGELRCLTADGHPRDIPALPPPASNDPADADAMAATLVRGWMDVLGPVSAAELAARSAFPVAVVDMALLRLENSGVVLRGHFTGRTTELEWCERALLARIHRLTLGRLRKEIEAVSAADFIRFLLRWQHLQPSTQLHGRDGLQQIIAQLQGLELPAGAWEDVVLPRRLIGFAPDLLENLCLAGAVAWGRLRPPAIDDEPAPQPEKRSRRSQPTRSAAIAFVLREDLPLLLASEPLDWNQVRAQLSSAALTVFDYLLQNGASFTTDIARDTRLLPAWTEQALWELVAMGLVTGDGLAGLRGLLAGDEPRAPRPRMLGRPAARLLPVGRWSLWRSPGRSTLPATPADTADRHERLARQLLRRWGIVFRDVIGRERGLPPWRELLTVYRRLEAQGQIRGGRFVNGFIGEQYALPEAVEALRAMRRQVHHQTEEVLVAASDPLNLVGVITPDARISPYSGQGIVYRDGVPHEVGPYGALLRRTILAPSSRRAPEVVSANAHHE
jgi:ATP-dependent Lhr-like helicase